MGTFTFYPVLQWKTKTCNLVKTLDQNLSSSANVLVFGVPTSGHGRLLLRLRAEGIGGGVDPQEDPCLEAREEEKDNSWR